MDLSPKAASLDGFESKSPELSLSAWNYSAAKRVFDFLLSTLLLLLTSPAWLLVALAIKISSSGSVFFRQLRVGRGGVEFCLLKFRTMRVAGAQAGPGLTRKGDLRVTPVGRILRKWKLDELPQLINVLRGDMSIVGPRPDLEEYMRSLPASQKAILKLRPGVTGTASLRFRHEEDVLAKIPADQLQQLYVSELLPQKVELDLEYARRATFLTDLGLVLRTVSGVLS